MIASPDARHCDGPGGAERAAADPADAVAAALMRCRRGERDGVADLYDLTSPLVYGLATAGTTTAADAARLTTRVYASAWRQSVTFRPGRTCAVAWLLRITSDEIARAHSGGDHP